LLRVKEVISRIGKMEEGESSRSQVRQQSPTLLLGFVAFACKAAAILAASSFSFALSRQTPAARSKSRSPIVTELDPGNRPLGADE
jgi:hypothetical protein